MLCVVRSRESRSRKAAGPRNSPEALPTELGGSVRCRPSDVSRCKAEHRESAGARFGWRLRFEAISGTFAD